MSTDAARPTPQIFLFHGDDAYAQAEARQKLELKLLDPGWRDFNLVALGGDAGLRKVVDALLAVSFGGGNRLVVVKEPAFLQGKADETGLAEFERLLDGGLPEGSHLLLLTSKLDSRLKLVKKLVAVALVREMAAAKPWQVEERLGPWVESLAAERQRRISAEAVSALLVATAGDRYRVQREMEKLTTYAPEGARITPEMVRELVAGGDIEVFALTEALARRKAGEALVAVNRLLTGDHALKTLAAVVTVMRGWLRLKTLAEQGLSAQAIAQATGARGDFKVRKDLDLIKAWRADELASGLERLLEVDLAIKSGTWPAEQHRLLFEKTVMSLLTRRP